MFCIKCGTEIIEGAEFCPSCGQPVINIPPVQKEGAQPQQQQQFTQPQQQFAQPQQQFAQPVQTYPGNYDPDPQSSQHRAIGIIATIVAFLGVIFIWIMPCVTFKLGYAASEMFGINTKHSLITLGEASNSPESILGFGIFFCILTLLPILEFTLPRKTGINYLKHTRSGWISFIIIIGLSVLFEVTMGIGFSNDYSFKSIYEFNALYYIGVIFHVGILILSIIMTATISKLRTQQYNYLKSIDYDVKGI